MVDKYVLSGEDKRRVERSVRHTERHVDKNDLRKRNHPGGGGTNKIYARIVSTLRRADPAASPPVTAQDYYEIELLRYTVDQWSATHGVYYVGDKVKYTVGNVVRIYICKFEHASSSALPPTVVSHWEESTYKKAWVFGYSGDLLASAPWFQVNDIVEVVKYKDSRWTDRQWWILETAVKIEEGTGTSKKASLYWLQEDENGIVGRLCSVYR
ncbi:MAG: hypothetical protein GWN55_11585 [Phycisphaerae bacterium]|nr:hypothetical protein [Phycisphaerae bacterium]NIR66267.1 hypothetical protein [candidate division Zixibacteria bacterium]NIW47403.1 hypothetical protein [Gammaproteobacteria bacterium]NIP55514.1 hypothetical protein [Phycisphaerae bacterium]NIS54206.1 hypothetical protein [Phycisphaerae bacterium]